MGGITMNKSKSVRMIVCLALVFSVLLAACGNNSNTQNNQKNSQVNDAPISTKTEKKELLVYDYGQVGQPDSELYLSLIEAFNSRDDVGSTLNYQYVPGDSYYPKLNAVFAANEPPALLSAHAAGKLKPYVDADKVIPLNEYLDADPEWKSRFKDGVFDNVSFDGKVYGIPTQMNATGLFYNEQILGKYNLTPPSTYEEMKNVINVLKDNGVVPIAFGAKNAWSIALFAEIITNRIGGNEPYDNVFDGTGTWEESAFIRTGEILQELVEMDAFSDGFLGLSYDEALAQFMNGQAGMFVMGSWVMGSLGSDESEIKDVVRVAPFPTFEEGKGDPNTWLGQPDRSLVISKEADNVDDLIEFIKGFSTDDIQSQIAEKTGNLTVTKTELDSTKVLPLGVELSKLMESMTQMVIFYDVGLGAAIGDEYNNTIVSILAGRQPAEAFAKLQKYTEDNR
jgi:raffinose/stachyose/melibiose transport system substrate-binding protein